jgi:hypothetical protein
MKITFQNTEISDIKDMKSLMRQGVVKSTEEVALFTLAQSRANAPRVGQESQNNTTINTKDPLADSIKITKAPSFKDPSFTVSATHRESMLHHEAPYTGTPTDPAKPMSETGGVGNKFITRSVENAEELIKGYYVAYMHSLIDPSNPEPEMPAKSDVDDSELPS